MEQSEIPRLYLTSLRILADTQESYDRNEASEEDLKNAHNLADSAFLAVEKYWASLDAKKEKEK